MHENNEYIVTDSDLNCNAYLNTEYFFYLS